jgi:hypothetical protein
MAPSCREKGRQCGPGKAFFPAPYARLGLAGPAHDHVRADAIGRKQEEFG